MRKLIICVTGTPCTGKTELSKLISRRTGLKHLNLNKKAKSMGLINGYDSVRRVYIVDENLLTKKVRELAKKAKYGLIIDSHISHFVSPKMADLCIVCRCELKELKKRLKNRGYTIKKVRENLESEIFEICENEAIKRGHKIIEIDCSNKKERNEELKKVLKKLTNKRLKSRKK